MNETVRNQERRALNFIVHTFGDDIGVARKRGEVATRAAAAGQVVVRFNPDHALSVVLRAMAWSNQPAPSRSERWGGFLGEDPMGGPMVFAMVSMPGLEGMFAGLDPTAIHSREGLPPEVARVLDELGELGEGADIIGLRPRPGSERVRGRAFGGLAEAIMGALSRGRPGPASAEPAEEDAAAQARRRVRASAWAAFDNKEHKAIGCILPRPPKFQAVEGDAATFVGPWVRIYHNDPVSATDSGHSDLTVALLDAVGFELMVSYGLDAFYALVEGYSDGDSFFGCKGTKVGVVQRDGSFYTVIRVETGAVAEPSEPLAAA